MDVYYHVKFQLCITSGSKVNRAVQNCVFRPPGIGLNSCLQAKNHLRFQLEATQTPYMLKHVKKL